jgi:HK97 family phage portal protein
MNGTKLQVRTLGTRDGLKATVIAPDWLPLLLEGNRNSVGSAEQSFARVPLVFRATRLRCNSLARVPVHIYEGDTELTEPWDVVDQQGQVVDLNDWIWRTEAANLLAGGAFWLHLRSAGGANRGAQWLNPFTVNVEWGDAGRTYAQNINGVRFPQTGVWTDEEVLFWREYNPVDDVTFGVSAAGVALGDAQLMHSLTRFAATFFEGGAMPVTVLSVAAGTSDPDRERIESFFKRMTTGLRNAFRVLAVRGDFKPQVLTPPLEQLALPELRSQAIDAVSWAFDVPRTMLTADAANYATATSDFNGFLTQTIIPRAKYVERNVNTFLEDAGTDYRVEFAPEEMTELQEDENLRATAFASYVTGGMDRRVAVAVLGIDIPESVMPIWEEQGAASDQARNQLPPSTQPATVAPGAQTSPSGDTPTPVKAELDRWERKALKRLKQKGKAACEFESDDIPATLAASILGALETLTEAGAVKAVFEDARTWGAYP